MGIRSRYTKTKRAREVSVEKVEKIREMMKFQVQEIAELLGVSSNQYTQYKKCGLVPADRYYAMINGLIAAEWENMNRVRDMLNAV